MVITKTKLKLVEKILKEIEYDNVTIRISINIDFDLIK